MFREPFFSDVTATAEAPLSPPPAKAPSIAAPPLPDFKNLEARLNRTTRGVCVVGALDTPEEIDCAREFIKRLGWVTFADTLSGLRQDRADDLILTHGDLSLLAQLPEESRPEMILHIGGRLVSKRVATFLAPSQGSFIASITPSREFFNPHHGIRERIIVPLTDLARLELSPHRPTDSSFVARVKARNAAITAFLEDTFTDESRPISEPAIARAISKEISPSHTLMLGNSMPIRDFELFAVSRRDHTRIIANRGASGIDGVLATALGAAIATQRPLTLLIGDLSLLHDLNSLSLAKDLRVPVSIIAINNDGGGIFSLLPVSKTEHFERLFATPHGLKFEDIARGFGLSYAAPSSMDTFVQEYRSSSARRGTTLIEVQTSRAHNADLHRSINETILTLLNDMARP
jgi:2-succinyl-5-enolpyruvyl-6-hydroxy-3-cyclohexene-1-carboxylate synthase